MPHSTDSQLLLFHPNYLEEKQDHDWLYSPPPPPLQQPHTTTTIPSPPLPPLVKNKKSLPTSPFLSHTNISGEFISSTKETKTDTDDCTPLNLDAALWEEEPAFWSLTDSLTDPEEVTLETLENPSSDLLRHVQRAEASLNASPTIVSPNSYAYTNQRSPSVNQRVRNGKRFPSSLPRPQFTTPVRTTINTPRTPSSKIPFSVVPSNCKYGVQSFTRSESVNDDHVHMTSPLFTPSLPPRPIAPVEVDGRNHRYTEPSTTSFKKKTLVANRNHLYNKKSTSTEEKNLSNRNHLYTEQSISIQHKHLANKNNTQQSSSETLVKRNHSSSFVLPTKVKCLIPCHPTPPKSPQRLHQHGIGLLSLVLLLWICSLASAATVPGEASSHLFRTSTTTQSSDRRDPVSPSPNNVLVANPTAPATTSTKTLKTAEPPVVINQDEVNGEDAPSNKEAPWNESEHHIIVFLAIFGSILGAGFVAGIAYLVVRQNRANRHRKALETCGIKSSVLLQTRRPSNVSMTPSFRDRRERWSIASPFRDPRENRSMTPPFRDRRESSHSLEGVKSMRSASDPSLRKYSISESRYAASYEGLEPDRLLPRERPRTLPSGGLSLLPPTPSYNKAYNIKTRHAGGPDHSQLLAASPHRKYSR